MRTEEEIAAIQAARVAINTATARIPMTYAGGRVATCADAAERAIFGLLNYASAFLHDPLASGAVFNVDEIAERDKPEAKK